ncbi:MAG: hypothetical protein ACRELX_05185 [Longimicrobiales bacterium]
MRQLHHVLLVVGVSAGTVACGSASPRSEPAGGTSATQVQGTGEYDASVDQDTARVRAATAAFTSLDAAAAAGYAPNIPQCLAHPEHGGMGFHHVNQALLDDRLEVERPEILVYERTADGEYVLNGVEYIVPYTARGRDEEPPTIMGQQLKPSDPLQLWYLHVWLFKENSAGLFADWNPDVECR